MHTDMNLIVPIPTGTWSHAVIT